jgi:NAD(P)-dependent dehydrogenase (short-subunit alcohol dehydrogenase family)
MSDGAVRRSLTGKRVLVTGASRGIGLAVAKACLAEGALVAGCGRSAVAPQELAGSVEWIAADLARHDDVERLAGTVLERWGALDGLVNNAGLLGTNGELRDLPEDVWDDVLAVNLTAPFLLSRRLGPLMPKGGSIVSVTSGYAIRGRARGGVYGISKAALEILSQTLAAELLDAGVRVNVVDPHAVRTSMRAAVAPSEDPMTLPAPEDVAPLFVWLLSDASRGITGQRLDAASFARLAR